MKTRNTNTRRFVDIALFSAIGAILEAAFGSISHTFRMIPFSGLIPTTALITVFSALYAYRRSAPDIMLCGVVIALLKLLSPGGNSLFAISAVLIESGLMVLGLRILPGSHRIGLVVTACFVSLWPVFQRVLILIFFIGITLNDVFSEINKITVPLIPKDATSLLLILTMIAALHFTSGMASALLGWHLGSRLNLTQTMCPISVNPSVEK